MKFREPLPISKGWVIFIRFLLYGGLLVIGTPLIFDWVYMQVIKDTPINLKALSVCTELESAIQRFYDDNGTLPADISTDTTFDSNSAMGLKLLRILHGDGEKGKGLSVKSPNYLNLKQGKNNMDGLIYDESGTQIAGLYDPWGGSYQITLDGDFDEEIIVWPKAQKQARKLQRRVAVWSDGKDGVKGVGKAADDVTTW